MAILNIVLCLLNICAFGFVFTLIVKDFPFEAYNEKRIIFKFASAFIIGIMKGPLFIITTYLSLHAFTDELSDSSFRFLSIASASINMLFLTMIYTYFGSALLNLPLPNNNKIPWGESSHKPA